ncbi:molybdenum cofactor guanylyltransferase MobA [Cellvibrio sp.]|uniref:molybdenum cofactor guanylyltransferase MobA n=1 Tax=Cellvibrio sp. TaxID=1965322 RepID=UPI00396473BE
MCIGVIVAGGRSRRMGGGDKFLLPLGEKTIIERTVDRAVTQVTSLLFNCNSEREGISSIGIPVVKDIFEGWRGPLAGIHAGLNWMTQNQPESEWLASFAADTPFFPEDLVGRLLEQAEINSCDLVVATHNSEIQPLFALWNISLLYRLEEHLLNGGNPKMQTWMASQNTSYVEFGNAEQNPFFNINTPSDLSEAESMVKSKK